MKLILIPSLQTNGYWNGKLLLVDDNDLPVEKPRYFNNRSSIEALILSSEKYYNKHWLNKSKQILTLTVYQNGNSN